MTTISETDLKELKDLINSRFDHLEKEVSEVKTKLTELDKRTAIIETRLDDIKPSVQKIPDLAEKVGELKNWKQISLVFITAIISSIFSGTIGGVIGWLLRNGKF